MRTSTRNALTCAGFGGIAMGAAIAGVHNMQPPDVAMLVGMAVILFFGAWREVA